MLCTESGNPQRERRGRTKADSDAHLNDALNSKPFSAVLWVLGTQIRPNRSTQRFQDREKELRIRKHQLVSVYDQIGGTSII